MVEPLADRVKRRIGQAAELYHRLLDSQGKEPGRVRIVLE